jgi:uncharacterized protein YndB with AHSA1/START domain
MNKQSNVAAKVGSAPNTFTISHTFGVPREVMWRAWSERDQLMQWFGPKGVSIAQATLDFRPGGFFHFCMRLPDGKAMWGKFVYREIEPPRRVVWVNSFSDENRGVIRHPMRATWPLEMLTVATFAEEEGKTTVTVRWTPIGATEEESETFNSNHESMQMGWTGTFEQLAEYLRET